MYPKFSKRDADRHIFLLNVEKMKLEIWNLIFKQIGVNLHIFDYASRLGIQMNENIFKIDNIVIVNVINTLFKEVETLIKKVKFSSSLKAETRDKITDILFEAKQKAKELQEDIEAENKLLDKIIQTENKQVGTEKNRKKMKQKILKKANSKQSFLSSKPKIALIVGIFLGWAGADRFYKGDIWLGIFKLISFGGLGLWWILDLFIVPKQVNQEYQSSKMTLFEKIMVVFVVSAILACFSITNNEQQHDENQSIKRTSTLKEI